jgi:chromosome segregation ATPase
MTDEKLFPEENQDENTNEALDNSVEPEAVNAENEPVVETEDEPMTAEETAVEEDKTLDNEAPTEKKQTPTWVKKSLIWIVILVLVFLSGVILSQLTSVTPLRNNLKDITSQNINHLEEISELKAELESTKSELADTKSNLSDSRESLSESNQNLQTSENEKQRQTNLLELQYNIAMARVAITNEDKLSARQSVNLAEDNLAQLDGLLDSEIYEILQERLDSIQQNVKSNLTKAAEELRMLSENLERIK